MRASVSLCISAMVAMMIPAACTTSTESQAPEAQGSGGRAASGGSSASGGAAGSGGASSSGGRAASGGSSATGGAGGGSGGRGSGGDTSGSGGANGGDGGSSDGSGGAAGAGGSSAAGGRARGGTGGSGGGSGVGGSTSVNGAGGSGSGGSTTTGTTTPAGDCSITITNSAVSSAIATVGIVEWSTSLTDLASAKIVYTLNNAGTSVLNAGGEAPVDLKKANHRTLLLGLKPSSTYTFHVETTTAGGSTCKSADKTLTTGTLSGAPSVTRTASKPSAQAGGFIVTSTGMAGGGGPGGGGGSGTAYIMDADGTVVWAAAAPTQCSRAHMDFEGNNMWMLSLNVGNSNGEMRFVSMDGLTSKNNVGGLSAAHHDFTVVPGKIAAMVWATTGARDPESNLVEMAADGSGTATTVFKIGGNLYSSSSFHCNHIVYHASEDTFTIADRNPNLVVKVKHDGTPVWQIGGSCTGAPAPKCASGTWKVNHGHDFDGKGNMLLFNNGQSNSTHVFQFKLEETGNAISYTTVKDFTSGISSNVMGDVQFLPNGNVLITYSTAGTILEVDSSWATVQTLKSSVGYAEWRETLYGPPARK